MTWKEQVSLMFCVVSVYESSCDHVNDYDDCVLPCSFHPGSDEVIHWHKLEDKVPASQGTIVHSYYYNTDQLKEQSQPYRGRTALFNDQIPKGNASLLLRCITLQDQGRYKCYTSTIKGNKESFINIAVEGTECLSVSPVRLVDIQLSDDIITCSSTGIYPEPKLTWSTDPPSDLSFDPGTIQNSTSIKVEDRGLYDITSTKQFSRSQTNICTVTSGTVERTATLKQQGNQLINLLIEQFINQLINESMYLSGCKLRPWNINVLMVTCIYSYYKYKWSK
uniref:Ig-like domain-containing protein n=1 Tax=Hucho hucho TaxID=62062 RepID=A0A4W5MS34_9TELE